MPLEAQFFSSSPQCPPGGNQGSWSVSLSSVWKMGGGWVFALIFLLLATGAFMVRGRNSDCWGLVQIPAVQVTTV